MTAKIRVWISRNILMAGRLVLVNYVLMSLYLYWGQMFILTKNVLEKVNAILKAYLRHGNTDNGKLGYVSWDHVCMLEKDGGLGVMNTAIWNTTAVGKLVRDVAKKQDSMWVRWVHIIYIKRNHGWSINLQHTLGKAYAR